MTKARAVRVLFYLLGLLTLAFGLTLNTKTGFGRVADCLCRLYGLLYLGAELW